MARDFALPGRSPVYASECAVATSHALATTTAISILKEGGNAVDAAIAASATLCVVEPHMTGIGGDCFAIVGEADGTLHGLNGSGRSAADASLDWYLEKGISSLEEMSPHAVTSPGSVKAWEGIASERPELQRTGRSMLRSFGKTMSASHNLLLNGNAPNIGEKFHMPLLAKTLREIAMNGSSAFYEGAIAKDIADTVQSLGGFLSEEDLAGVSGDWVDLISTEYQGHTLHEIPPNAQGLTAIMLVKLLAKLKSGEDVHSAERAHLEMELGRISYAARDAYISDENHMSYSVDELLSDGHIDKLAELYDPQKHNSNIALPDPTGSDTIYLTVVDRDGMAVSFINSVFKWFGSGIMTPNSGINGKISHSYGVMGGSYQAMGHAHVLSNMLDYGMDPQAALDNPRIFWDDEGALQLEAGISETVQAQLEAKGHVCSQGAVHGGGQVIQIDHENGVLIAGI
ncbi:Glutathione hydrolase-like YwrD proenzyme [Nymphon striatum]|nr:Glutathione hydrolase-like YwrD proenzyme [Nymphon striatum]